MAKCKENPCTGCFALPFDSEPDICGYCDHYLCGFKFNKPHEWKAQTKELRETGIIKIRKRAEE